MRFLTIVLVSGVLLTTSLHAADPTAPHKQLYKEINEKADSLQVVKKEAMLSEYSETPSVLTGWFDAGQLRKLLIEQAGSHGTISREYYFDGVDGDAPKFVFQITTTESVDGSQVSKAEDRYYFNERGLFRWLDAEKQSVSKEDPRFYEREEELLNESAAGAKLLPKSSDKEKQAKGGTEKFTDGVLTAMDQGDYLHARVTNEAGEEVSFWVIRPDSSFDKVIENPEKYIGKRVRIYWKLLKENIPEAGGMMEIESAQRIEFK